MLQMAAPYLGCPINARRDGYQIGCVGGTIRVIVLKGSGSTHTTKMNFRSCVTFESIHRRSRRPFFDEILPRQGSRQILFWPLVSRIDQHLGVLRVGEANTSFNVFGLVVDVIVYPAVQ